MPTRETAFSIDTSSIKYGPGVTGEVGYEMRRLGARRVMVLTDSRMAREEPVSVALAALRAEGIEAVLYDQVRIAPTDISFQDAAPPIQKYGRTGDTIRPRTV